MEERCVRRDGVKVFAFPDEQQHSFCLSVYVRAGSIYEGKEDSGITHLLEHILFRSLKKRYGEEFYDLLALHGLSLSGTTYKEFLRFYIEGPREGFAFAAQVLCGLFAPLSVSATEYRYEKGRIKAEIREKEERSSMHYAFSEQVWGGTNNALTVLGYCRVLDRLSLTRLEQYRQEVFTPENCFVYVTGCAGEAELELLCRSLPAAAPGEGGAVKHNRIRGLDRFFHRRGITVREKRYCSVYMGFDVDVERYDGGVQDLLYDILLCGENALLFQNLSENDPLIYSYSSNFEQYDNVGNLSFDFEIAQDDLAEGLTRVVRALQALKRGDFHFEANLRYAMAGWEMLLDDPGELNWSMAYNNHILRTDRIDYSQKTLGRFASVTKEAVTRAAEEIFRRENLIVVIGGKKRRIKTEPLEAVLAGLNEEMLDDDHG